MPIFRSELEPIIGFIETGEHMSDRQLLDATLYPDVIPLGHIAHLARCDRCIDRRRYLEEHSDKCIYSPGRHDYLRKLVYNELGDDDEEVF